ncbi:MAG: tetratricopeptide repeat protein, partial [Pseudomonadota bacterium]
MSQHSQVDNQIKTHRSGKMSYIYNPANQTPEELIENFVTRKKEFQRIFSELKNADLSCSAQHFLIEGQRGTGKTSLLLRLKYELEAANKYPNFIAVQFAEEQYNIFDLCRLWENAAEALEDIEGFENISNELDERNEEDNYSHECFDIIEKYLITNNKRLVLLLDNFGDILDRLSDIEQKRLRDIFHTSTHIQLIASSSKALEHTYKHNKPFFEFFKIIKLEGLNKKETHSLLEQLTKSSPEHIKNIIQTQPNRIETIRRLTGGIPRTIILLFEIFLDESANVFEDLEMILDRVTPLYKHRMDDLPTQQQAIMDTIALNWDGISSKEIVNGLKKRGFDTKKVSTQLILLEKSGLTISKKIDKKNKIYFIKERFFNIWYLMRYGRKKNKSQVLWLVKFLQEWCDGSELISRAKNHIQLAKENSLHAKGGLYMAEALASIVSGVELQHELISETRKALIKTNPDIDKKLSKSDIELFDMATMAVTDKKYDLAINKYKILVNKGHVGAMYNLGYLYQVDLKNFEKSINYYQMAIENGYESAMTNLGNIYQNELKDFDKAINYYQMAVEKGEVNAMFNLGKLYNSELKDFQKAINYYQMAIKKGEVNAMFNLGYLYNRELKDF